MKTYPPPGPMLEDLANALGGIYVLQEAISKRVSENGPMLRMEAVRQLWEETCVHKDQNPLAASA